MERNFDFEKLRGGQNYHTWQFAMMNYLSLKGLGDCIEHKPNTPAVPASTGVAARPEIIHPEDVAKETDTGKLSQAKAYLVLGVDASIYVHIQKCDTALGVWNCVKKLYEDRGLSRKIVLLGNLLSNKLCECDGMQDYVDKIASAANKLQGIGFAVNDEWLGAILLAGLTDEFKPFIMGLETNSVAISGDLIITKLLDSYSGNGEGNSAFIGKKPFKKWKRQRKCYNCSSTKHLANACDQPKKEKKKENNAKAAFMMGFLGTNNKKEWYIDSGATRHMTPYDDLIDNKKSESDKITAANGAKIDVTGIGKGKMTFGDGYVSVKNVMHVPDLAVNLLSVSQIVKGGNSVLFNSDGCTVYNDKSEKVLSCKTTGGVYRINSDDNENKCFMAKNKVSALTWHRRLGHANYQVMKKMRAGAVHGVSFEDDDSDISQCEICAKGKQAKLPFKDSKTESNDILELIHSDLMGPQNTRSLGHALYLLTFIDDYSRKVFVYFLKKKDETFSKFVEFKAFIEKQTGKEIKTLRTDNGGEYMSNAFDSFLKKSGIKHETTVAYTPEQNGVAERMNRTLTEKAKCFLFDAELPTTFWAEAINMAAYVVNRMPCRKLMQREKQTPNEYFSNEKCDLSDLKLFGSKVMVLKPKQQRSKFDENSTKMVFVGYDDCVKGYRCVNVKTRKMNVSRNVKFFEYELKKTLNVCCSDESCENNDKSDECNGDQNETDASEMSESSSGQYESLESSIENNDDTLTEGESTQNQSALNETNANDTSNDQSDLDETNTNDTLSDPDFQTRANTNNGSRSSSRNRKPFTPYQYMGHFAFFVEPAKDFEPNSVNEALNGENSKKWSVAMNEEIEAHKANGTWMLVDLPSGRKPITAKWVFKVKSIGTKDERFKARLVARGYAQVPGIDYYETFSPVVRHTSLRILFAIAVKNDFKIFQMDAITAFLQSELEETIYMNQPEGYADSTKRVCLLKKSIYGLKQAGRQWNIKLNDVLKEFGLKRSDFDPCVYINASLTIIIAVYVDDFLIFYKKENEVMKLKTFLNTKLMMKEIGMASECIGIEITKSNGRITLGQQKYIQQVLKRFNMSNCNAAKSPGDPNEKLTEKTINAGNDLTGKVPFQELIGSLLYVAQITRPDISFCVNNVSRFNAKHSIEHWEAALRILKYLKGTADYVLVYKTETNNNMHAYSDADYASETDKRRSCSGFVVKFAGGAINWHSKRQEIVAVSSTEAEYIALSTTAKEMLYLNQFMFELTNVNMQPSKIYVDNTSSINLAKNAAYHDRTKHIDVRYHHLRDNIEKKKIEVEFVPTNENIADALTKSLNGPKTKQFANNMGLE